MLPMGSRAIAWHSPSWSRPSGEHRPALTLPARRPSPQASKSYEAGRAKALFRLRERPESTTEPALQCRKTGQPMALALVLTRTKARVGRFCLRRSFFIDGKNSHQKCREPIDWEARKVITRQLT